MLSNKVFGLLTVFLLSMMISSNVRAQSCCRNYEEFAAQCRAQGGRPSPNPARCEASAPTGGVSSDTRARDEARAREEAEARAREEAERDRIAEAKRKKDKEEKDGKFIRDRDEAANTLKGSTGTTNPNDFGLKGSGNYSLRDAVAEPGLKGSTTSSPDPSKQAAAWRQLHCAAYIFGYALSALQTKDTYNEYGTLSVEAMKALDGKRPNVVCKPPPSVPSVGGTEVDVDKLRLAEKDLIDRANALAQRMKQTPAAPSPPQTSQPPAPPPAAQPCTGTKMERLRCTQARLNKINEEKYKGHTKEEISVEEKNRKELADLVLINNGLEKGEFTSVSAPPPETDPKPRRRRPVQTPP
jgi:hypothetical protein